MGKGINGEFDDVSIRIRHDTSAIFTFKNPVLAKGEPGYEIDLKGLKFGDGITPWVSLPYFSGSGSGTVTSVSASISGALSVSGSPITTSGTLAFSWQGTSSQYVLGNGTLATIITNNNQLTNGAGYITSATVVSGYVPYSGATSDVNLNSRTLSNIIRLGLGSVTPTARLHLPSGATNVNFAPMKWNSGPLQTAPEIGAWEFLTDKWYAVITTGTARKEIALNDQALVSGQVPVATTNGRLTSFSNFLFDGTTLSPNYILLNAQITSAVPLQFSPSAVVPTSPITGSVWWSNATGLTISAQNASSDSLTVTNGTQFTFMTPLASANYIGAGGGADLILYIGSAAIRISKNTGHYISCNPVGSPAYSAQFSINSGGNVNTFNIRNSSDTTTLFNVSSTGVITINDGTQAANYVLTSTNTTGIASWQPVSSSSTLTSTYVGYGIAGVLGGTSDFTYIPATGLSFAQAAFINSITASTNVSDTLLTLTNNSSGTPAANYGLAQSALLKSTTTNSQAAGMQLWYWSVATHAARQSAYKIQLVGAASVGVLQDAFSIDMNGNSFKHNLFSHAGYDPQLNLYSGTTLICRFEAGGNDMYLSTFNSSAAKIILRPGSAGEMARLTNTAVSFGATQLFFWDNTNTLLYINGNSGAFANTKLQIYDNVNNFTQINYQNTNAGTTASTDYVATADTGTNTTNYVNLGINSSTFSDVTFSIGTILDSYLYANGGNMLIGSQSAKDTIFFNGGTLAANEIARFKSGVGFKLSGSLQLPYTAQTGTYAILTTDYTINCTSGTFTVTLPTAVGVSGTVYVIKNSGAGTITIATTSAQTIDGSATVTIAVQYTSLTLQSNGANWIIL